MITYMVYYFYDKEEETLLSPQDQLRYFLASVVTCKATQHPLGRFDEEQEMQQRWSDLSATTRTPCLHPTGRRTTMETRFYQTQEINIPPIAQALVFDTNLHSDMQHPLFINHAERSSKLPFTFERRLV